MTERLADLPPVLAAIAEVAGIEAALKVARAYGGTRVTMPLLPDGDNWLKAVVGSEAAAAIIQTLGSTRRVDIPLGPSASYFRTRREQVLQMRKLTDEGLNAPAIARRLGTTERSVRRWWARWKISDPNQGELFG